MRPHKSSANREWADRIAQHSLRCDNCLVQRAHVLDVCAMTAGPDAAALMFDSFAARDERKRLTRRELVGTGAGVTEVSVALPTRLRAAGIFVQQRMTIDSQIGDHVSAFDTTSEVQEYVQLQFWCCGHRLREGIGSRTRWVRERAAVAGGGDACAGATWAECA